MIKRIQLFLGPARTRAFVLLLGITGLLSLMLNAVAGAYDWVLPVQTALVVIFILGTALIFGGRMRSEDRLRWLLLLAPAVGAILLAALFFRHLLLLFAGGALGWIIAGLLVFRSKARMEYQKAIKFLRKEQYGDAVEVMDDLIKAEPRDPNHYRLRAEILRLWGKLGRAKRDYEKMIEIDPNSSVAFNGLAEVCLQAGEHTVAQEAALKAYGLAPGEWVAAYNLGMIEDRLAQPENAVEHLQKALALKVPDVRHRLLIHLYLARAYSRLGKSEQARAQVDEIRRHKAGLEEWQVILENEMAAVLRSVLEADIQTAQDLLDGKLEPGTFGQVNNKVNT